MVCPSMTLKKFQRENTFDILQGSYVLIEGAAGINEIQNDASRGIRSNGGSFLRNTMLRFRDFTDGSSNVVMIAEQSGRGFDGSGNEQDLRADHDDGIWMGSSGDARCYNTTTLRHPFGSTSSTLAHVGNSHCNTPFNSEHTGGIHVLMGDGAVRFVSSNVDFTTSKRLVSRKDNQVIGEF